MFNPSSLPHEYPRRFVPRSLRFNWEELSKLFDQLLERQLSSVEDLERWLDDESELSSVIYEERTFRMYRSKSQTDNREYEKAYQFYLEELEPKIRLGNFELDRKYVGNAHRDRLPADRYAVLNRKRENRLRIFREANVELEKDDSELAQSYMKTFGLMMVRFKGEDRTMQRMRKFLEETDGNLRQEAWLQSEARMARDAEAINATFDGLVKNRDVMAKNAGFGNYRDFAFLKRERFDYTPDDCFRFHEAVEKHFVPLSRDLDRQRMEMMGLEVLRPWDLVVDPKGREPLKPFKNVDGLLKGCASVFEKVDAELAGFFSRMVKLGLLDLESRKGKAPGGYQDDLTEVKLPFIFMNAVGIDMDIRILLHESGHCFHTFQMRKSRLPFDYFGQNLPSEFAEVASTSMELVGCQHMEGTFYDAEGAARSNREELITMVKIFPWVATIDAFQHWVYTHPRHTRDERDSEWLRIFRRFKGLESWEGYEGYERNRWLRQSHLFEAPFYYIDYGLATLGALGVWTRYRKDPRGAIDAYKSALALGGSKPLPELFQAAGLPWDMGKNSIEQYSTELRKKLGL